MPRRQRRAHDWSRLATPTAKEHPMFTTTPDTFEGAIR
jgi:hypothetical protein